MQSPDRRSFIAMGAASVLTSNSRLLGASDRVRLALIGARNQGRLVAGRAMQQGAEIATVCDIDEEIQRKFAAEAETLQKKRPAMVNDFRRVLEDKSIDGVIIAPPDHWHTHMALLACQAGKDVYVEKPLSQTIREGQLIRDAARKYNRIVQVGTQRRSFEHCISAAEYVGSGKLGPICLIRAWTCQVRKSIGNPPDGTPPAGVNYDAWLGPAPKRPFNPNRFHYNWRFFWDYGSSELGNQGVHKLDMVMAAIQKLRGKDKCLPVRISSTAGIHWLKDAKEVPDTQVVTYDFGDLTVVYELHSFQDYHPVEGIKTGVAFYGPESTLLVDNYGWKVVYGNKKEPGPAVKASGGSHEGNFIACVKSRQRPNSDVEIGRLSTMLCQLGNISHHLRRDVRFDPETETFGSDKEANAYLTKNYRREYPLPKV